MVRSSVRPVGVGLVLSVVVVAVSTIELLSGERSVVDISVLTVVALVTAATLIFLRRTADTLAVAVESREELRIRFEQQAAAGRLGQLALTNVSHQELLNEATRMVAEQLRAELGAVLELQPDKSFRFASAVGWSHDGPVPAGPASHGGYTLVEGEPVIMADASRETRFEISQAMSEEGIVSGLAAPIGLNGGAYGVLGVHTRSPHNFSDHDASFVAAVANILASAVRRCAAEAQAETTHRVLEAVIEGTSDDIFVKDLKGRFVVVNASAAKTLGRQASEVLGRSLDEVLPPAMIDAMMESDRLTLERGTVETYEETILVGGSTRVFLTTKGPYRSRDGALLGTFGIAHDITRRKEQERALGQSEERLRLAQEGADMGTWDIDLITGTTTWSDGLRRVYGVGPDYPAGFPHFPPLVHPDDREWVTRGVTFAYATGAPFEFECRLIRPDGELRWILARSTCIRDERGSPARLLGVSIDVTDRKLAQEELLRSREERAELELRLHQSEKLEAVGRLAGGVAHDFNNLLVAIRGYGELALGRLARGETAVSDQIRASLVASDRAAALTKQLLAFARRQVLNPEALDLNETVEETASLLARVIGDHVELVTMLAESPVVVQADRGQLEQVLVNLAVNGRDAMPEGGKLMIRVGADEATSRAVLSVTDEGTGIPPETAEHMFEPFFTTKGEDGTGLGLATVHGIVTQSSGEIALETEPGRGSTFTVFLPLCGEKPAKDEPVASDQPVQGTETLLLVEDEPTVRLVVSTMLETFGYEVVTAAGGDEAIAEFTARRAEISLVVSDLMMRGLDGRQTLERIRESAPATKGLLMSGYTDGMIVRSDVLDADTGFIQKPFSGEQLARRVRELLDDVAVMPA